jgi:adenosylcobyric acid synthase
LGFLDVTTEMTPDKRLTETQAVHAASGREFSGYEIHIGRTRGEDCARAFAKVDGRNEGAMSADGSVMGSYLHGMFSDDGFRQAFLTSLGAETSTRSYAKTVETTLDALADHIEQHLDVTAILAAAR